MQIFALPGVCGGIGKKDRVFAHHNREKENRISTDKVRGASR